MKKIFIMAIAAMVCSCAASGNLGVKRTETELGVGIQGNLAKEVAPKTTIHGLVSYNRFFFDGGHDNLFRLGLQTRRQLSVGAGNWWVGGEATYIHDISVYDGDVGFGNPSSSGYSVGALSGYGLKFGSLDGSIFAGISLIHFGDFKDGDLIIDEGGNSTFIRVGAEVKLPFFGN